MVAMVAPKNVFALDDLCVLTCEPILARSQIQNNSTGLSNGSITRAPSSDPRRRHGRHDRRTDTPRPGRRRRRPSRAARERAVGTGRRGPGIGPAHRARIRKGRDPSARPWDHADTSEAPLSVLKPLVSRLKVLGGLDIVTSRVPQDGRFSLKLHGRAIDVRSSPTPPQQVRLWSAAPPPREEHQHHLRPRIHRHREGAVAAPPSKHPRVRSSSRARPAPGSLHALRGTLERILASGA